MTKKWLGKNRCDMCTKKPSDVGDWAYDAVTIKGPWVFMCRPCFLNFGRMFGQEYDSKTLVKTRDLHTK